jgi:hypothetical protein
MSGKKTKEKRKKSVAETKPWTSFERGRIPQFPDIDVFINSRYQVNLTLFEIQPPFGLCIHLSIKTRDKAPVHDWRDFQRIKNELVGEEFEAVELYPAESRLVDTSNQYHLFCFRDFKFPFGYKKREVCEDTGNTGARQRPFELKPTDMQVPKLENALQTSWEEMFYGKHLVAIEYAKSRSPDEHR